MKNLATEALTELMNILGAAKISTEVDSLKKYGKDWTTYFDVDASAVVFPQSADEVVRIVRWARKHSVALIPSGGRTGLSGAAVATSGEVVVSFEKMNQILAFDPIDQTVRVQAGVITEELQKFAKKNGLFYPVDFAARGSSQIGGNIATNAGGIKVVRYGLTRDWVTGLTVVTGSGDLLELNNNLVKNASGLDLRHLFIGSEGILGFICEATIKLLPAPASSQVLILAVPDLPKIMDVFQLFSEKNTLTAFEMMSNKAMQKVLDSTGLPHPLSASSEYYLVIETEAASEEQATAIMSTFEIAMEKGWVSDGNLSQSEIQAKTFWRYREDISEALSKFSPYKNDISVPISSVPQFMQELDEVLAKAYPTWEVIWFGHVGDGNLHINILRPTGINREEFLKECRRVDQMVFKSVEKYRGSISAEHGVGLSKKSFLHFTRSAAEIELMKGIKKIFDPDHIINPGKVIDTEPAT